MGCVPDLRFCEFSGKWEIISLKHLLEFKNGLNASKEDYGFGIKFINVLDILENDYIIYDNILDYVNASEDQIKNYDVSYGDILFQRSSETREEVGMPNVYLDLDKNCIFGGFVIRGKKIGEYVPFFLKELLRSSKVRKDITSRSGGSTRYNIGQTSLEKVKIDIPSLEEQEKIANFLSKIDEKIAILEDKLQLWESFKKGIMQQLFSQELRFTDDDGNSYPDWEEKKLSDLVTIPRKEKLSSLEGKLLLKVKLHCKGIKINEGIKPKITKRGRPYYTRFAGEILIGRQNFHNGGFGIVPEEFDGGIASNAITSVVTIDSKINNEYLTYYFSRYDFY